MEDNEITLSVIKVFKKVYGEMGFGFLEKIYENAMEFEFRRIGIKYKRQFPIKIYYQGDVVGEYVADFLVEDRVVVELKAIPFLTKVEECQLLNYLNCTDKELGLLLNFGHEYEIKRKLLHNCNKRYKNFKS